MPYFVGLDASKTSTHVCVVDQDGAVVSEGAVESTPKAIAGFLRGEGRRYARIGMESWSLAPWLYEGLAKAKLPIICIEARAAHGIMKAQRNKTDRNDARGIAQIMRLGAYRTVHIKTASSQQIRALLTARETLAAKARDVTNSIQGLLLIFGLKLAKQRLPSHDQRVRALIGGRAFIASVIEPLLTVRTSILQAKKDIDARLLAIAEDDPVCRRLMTAPGVGALTALIYRASVDEPGRFAKSRSLGAHFGLTPRMRQSGETARPGRITRWGDGSVRRALFLAARSLCQAHARRSWLTQWADAVIARRGYMRGMVAVARRLAVVLHRMWVTQTDFRWEALAPA
ncbi:MAG: IS110 family transposase [Caulobacteraceae bacterium]|nr:IS110 family transposase [Caulobacteraceae bacterium]